MLATALQTALIFVFSYIWGKIAVKLAQKENIRTQARFNDRMVLKLAIIKLFLYLFPLLKLAFLQTLTSAICENTFVDAMDRMHNENPVEVNTAFYNRTTSTFDQDWFYKWGRQQEIKQNNIGGMMVNVMSKVYLMKPHEENTVCIEGCVPIKCWKAFCLTKCYIGLQRALVSLFVTHTLFTIAFIIVPIIKIKMVARKEMEISRSRGAGQTDMDTAKDYSLLQYQEKCDAEARYAYESWGGSYVEDFIELVLGFAVLVCFGIVYPLLIPLGCIAQIIEYRLLAYRTAWVTCRPFPQGASGIGEWTKVLEFIIYVAMAINILLLVGTMRTQIDNWSATSKILFISISFMVLVIAKVIMKLVLHQPDEKAIDATDMNNDFIQTLKVKRRTQGKSPISKFAEASVRLGVGSA